MTLSRNAKRRGKRTATALRVPAVGMAPSPTLASGALAAAPVGLLTADSYGALAEATITNVGTTTLNGDLGLSEGTSVTGAPTVTGSSRIGLTSVNPGGRQAILDLNNVDLDAQSRTPTDSSSANLGGQTLAPGVYKDNGTPASLSITGTFNGGGDAKAVFIFQSASTLTPATNSRVILTNGTQACNVFWQFGSSVTLGTSSVFRGTVIALLDITLNSDVVVDGRVLAGATAGKATGLPGAPAKAGAGGFTG